MLTFWGRVSSTLLLATFSQQCRCLFLPMFFTRMQMRQSMTVQDATSMAVQSITTCISQPPGVAITSYQPRLSYTHVWTFLYSAFLTLVSLSAIVLTQLSLPDTIPYSIISLLLIQPFVSSI